MKPNPGILVVISMLALGLVGCVSVNRHAENVCPEYAGLSCLSEVVCQPDEDRGCNVCYCHEAPADKGSPSDYDTGAYDDVTGP